MKGVHEHLLLRGYKRQDLFDTGGICLAPPAVGRAWHTNWRVCCVKAVPFYALL